MADLHHVVVMIPKDIIEVPGEGPNAMEGWFSRRELEEGGFKVRETYALWGEGEMLIDEMVPMCGGCLADGVEGWTAAMDQ